MYGLDLLDKFIREHPFLKVEDHPVVEKLCRELRIQNQEGLINDYICGQTDHEATASYLLGRYTAFVNRLSAITAEYRAEHSTELGSRDEEGLKWTKLSKEEWLLAMNPGYIGKVETLRKAENLLTLVRDLHKITFNRDDKLGQLSNNYRRELKGDNRA